MNTAHTLAEWNACRDWLLPALEDATEDEVINELLLNRAQLWRGDDAALVTSLERSPEPHVCLWLAGGRMRALVGLWAGLAAWGRAQGAVAARFKGRPGWARISARFGFEPDGDQFRRAL